MAASKRSIQTAFTLSPIPWDTWLLYELHYKILTAKMDRFFPIKAAINYFTC